MTPRFGIGGRLETWHARRARPETQRQALTLVAAAATPAQRVRALRLFAGLHQQDVRRMLNAPQDRVSNIERGRHAPTDEEYADLAALFGVPEAAIRGGGGQHVG